MLASMEGHMECVKVLLDNGAEINIQDKVSGGIIHSVHCTCNAACTRIPASE